MPRPRKPSAAPRDTQAYRHPDADSPARPEIAYGVVRVTGPFSFEVTIPTAEGLETEPETPGIQGEAHENYVARMLKVLSRVPVLCLPGNQAVSLQNIRLRDKTLTLSAEAVVAADVPAWFLDMDYRGMAFRMVQAFSPRTGAWEGLKKSLRVDFEDRI